MNNLPCDIHFTVYTNLRQPAAAFSFAITKHQNITYLQQSTKIRGMNEQHQSKFANICAFLISKQWQIPEKSFIPFHVYKKSISVILAEISIQKGVPSHLLFAQANGNTMVS